jgi:hypothetical protein
MTELVESAAVRRRLYECCNYSKTVRIIALTSVARIQLLKTKNI